MIGAEGRDRTGDLTITKWTASLQPVPFQSKTFGRFRALWGALGSRACNRMCNGIVALLLALLIPSVCRAQGIPHSIQPMDEEIRVTAMTAQYTLQID